MKKETSSLDLHYLIQEMQELLESKVDKIYLDKKKMLLQLHKTGLGKKSVFIDTPSFFYLISKKPAFPTTPSSFCMQLRKHLDQSRIRSISQIGFERIVKIVFSTKESEFYIYIELFTPGNIIFTNNENKIMGITEQIRFADRTIRPGLIYELPPSKINIKELSLKDFEDIIMNSKKESLVKSLAIELSLGGVYAEELCKKAGIDKNKVGVTKKEAEQLYGSFKEMLNQKTQGLVYDPEIFPFEIEGKKETQRFETFSAAIDSQITQTYEFLELKEEKSKHDKTTEKLLHVIKDQEKTIKKFEKEIEENQKKAEYIFEKYLEIQEILKQFKEAQKKYSAKELKEKIKEHKIIKEINEKDANITIEI